MHVLPSFERALVEALAALPQQGVVNFSRRGFFGLSAGALVLAVAAPARAQGPAGPGTRIPAFLEIRPDNSVRLLSPFVEGGQGINTGLAQTIGEELDLHPSRFQVECAPVGADYLVVGGMRMTGGSLSTRSSFAAMRMLGASARDVLLQAAALQWGAPRAELTTQDGVVVHAPSKRTLTYGALAPAAMNLAPDANVRLRDRADFRYIGKPIPRFDARDKSSGRAVYGIDLKVEGMLQAAVRHAPHYGRDPLGVENVDALVAMPGVFSVNLLPGAVAVTADSWYRAKKAVEAAKIRWSEPKPDAKPHATPDDFSSQGHLAALKATQTPGAPAEKEGDAASALNGAKRRIEAEYNAPYLAHAQLEPPSAIARFNADGSLDLWTPNQAPDAFRAFSAQVAGVAPEKVTIHSPQLGGFFGRYFIYGPSNVFPQAILLAKATGRPVKVIWSREEEFLADAMRPIAYTRFSGALDDSGMPAAIQARIVGEGPLGRWLPMLVQGPVDPSAVEGIVKKPYAIPNRAIEFAKLPSPGNIGFWRSVGHSMNDFFYESFLDEMADAGGRDPFELRMALLKGQTRFVNLLEAAARLSGGWKRGPYEAEGGKRARGVAMASPFGSETATIAEVSLQDGQPRVHNVWVAFDPGSIVNPLSVKLQVESAVALGVSTALFEQMTYKDGARQAQNYDSYPILTRAFMPKVHVEIIESGAPMGGVGEPGLPGAVAAIANAVSTLTGQRVRALPMSQFKFKSA